MPPYFSVSLLSYVHRGLEKGRFPIQEVINNSYKSQCETRKKGGLGSVCPLIQEEEEEEEEEIL
jgi:hypothetical protein